MMGNYEQLKTAVASIIRDNGEEEITGNVLQSVLISIINSVGSGAVFAGIATPSTSPSNPDPNTFYIAVEAGVYPNFNLTVTTGMCIFSNETGTWVGHELGVSSQFESGEYITDVSITDTLEGAETDNLPTVGAVNEAVTALNTAIATERHDRQEADGNQTVALNLEKTLRQQGDEANSASVGYYVCDTAAATAAKAVNASGYVLRIGGNIRIEMTNANTADGATLNINGTGAKALFYNGERASASNSWETGEIISVFYDGTRFMASNSQGGGGKAEKIKYDNSQSGLAADNVQGALDEIKNNIDSGVETEIKISLSPTFGKGYIDGTTGDVVQSGNSPYRYTSVIPVQEGQVIYTIYSGNYTMGIAAYNNGSPVVDKSVVCLNQVVEAKYVVPEGVNSIRICFKIDSVSENAFYVQIAEIVNLLDKIETIEEDVEELHAETSMTSKVIHYAYTLYDGYIDSSGVLHSVSGVYKYTNLIPVQEGEFVDTIVSGNNVMGIAAYTESDTTTADVSKSYIVPNIVSTQHYEVPQGIAYVRICHKNDISDDDFYINIYHFISVKEGVSDNRNDIESLRKSLVISIDEIEKAAGRAFYNNELTNINGCNLKKYDVSSLERVYVTTSWQSASAGFYMVTFLDSNNGVISSVFMNEANTTLTLTDKEIYVPEDAVYMYVNSRYNSNLPIVKVDYSSEFIEEKIAGLSSAKEISILFIGNSLTQDAVSYVPLLLRELAPDLKFKIYIWYNGGYTLSQQLADFNNNVACDIFSVCEDGTSWANFSNSVTMSSVLSTYKFDIVSIQEYFNYQETINVSVFNSVVEYIENHYGYPFKVVTLFHQPKRDTPAVIFERTKVGNATLLKETVAEDMIPSGIAIYRALSTTLDSLGDSGHLSPDGTHAQEGLPCMMQAYVTAMWILKQVGVPMSVNNAASVVDNNNYDSINVPGANLGTGVVIGTTEQVRLSQLVAIKAFKEGEYFVNSNLTEHTA